VAFINAGHLSEGEIDYSDMNFIDEKTYENLRSGKVKKGDILFAFGARLENLGLLKMRVLAQLHPPWLLLDL